MKKLFILLFACLFIVACGGKKKEVAKDDTPQNTVLILYYSQTGATASVANQLKSFMEADIEEIICENPYSGDFEATIERCKKEREKGEIPAIKPIKSDVQKYDIIFLGYPIWFGTYAPPIASLIENAHLEGKMIVPFCTFGSGGLDSSVKDLENKQPNAEILPGYGVRTARIDAAPQEIDRFLKEGGFIEGEYEKYDDFSEVRPATEEESAIFDAAVNGYPMIHAKAKNVSSRAVTDGTEYLFEAEDIPGSPAFADAPHTIKVYVLDLDGKEPVFTQVLR